MSTLASAFNGCAFSSLPWLIPTSSSCLYTEVPSVKLVSVCYGMQLLVFTRCGDYLLLSNDYI